MIRRLAPLALLAPLLLLAPTAPTATAVTAPIVVDMATDIHAGGGNELLRLATSAQALKDAPTATVLAGDVATDGLTSQYVKSFANSWGRLPAVFAAPGNHDYRVPGAADFKAYFKVAQTYRSENLGRWHIVLLDSMLPMQAGSAQNTWLKADLAANAGRPILAAIHYPRYASKHADSPKTQPLIDVLAAAHADLLISGHDHIYQRMIPSQGIQSITMPSAGEKPRTGTPLDPHVAKGLFITGYLKVTLTDTTWRTDVKDQTGVIRDTASGVVHNLPSSPVTAPAAAVVVPVVHGLLDRFKAPSNGTPLGWVIDPTWASVQPVKDGPLVTTQIDSEIAAARAKGLRVKLRVNAGVDSPAWVKALGGGPVVMTEISQAGTRRSFTVPRWWTPEVETAYDQLQAKLAAKYDGNPTIGQVTLNGPTAEFAEPYLRDASEPGNAASLLQAGFTVAKDRVAHDRNMYAGKAWKVTNLEIAFNPYQTVTPTKVFPDVAYTLEEMHQFRALYGSRAVLANYSISDSRGGTYATMYAAQKALGGPISYQTATAAKIGNWEAVLAFAVSQGASSVELPVGYLSWNQTTLRSFNSRLALH